MESNLPIKVIIADDHDVFRDGLQSLLCKDSSLHMIAQASNGRELIEIVEKLQPDIVITDLRMPILGGVEAIRQIAEKHSHTRMIALSTFDNENLIVEALEAGAIGYIIKNAQRGEIIEAIKTVYTGQPYYCLSTSAEFVKRLSGSSFNPYKAKSKMSFSDKEKQIITLICNEKSSREIASSLYINLRTVERIRSQLLDKMNVKTSAGIAIYAVKNGLYHFNRE